MAILKRGEAVERPPALIVQGTADANVTPMLQQWFAAAYRQPGGGVMAVHSVVILPTAEDRLAPRLVSSRLVLGRESC